MADLTPADWHRKPGVSVVFRDERDEREVGRIEAVVETRCYVKVPRGRTWPSRRMIWLHEIEEVIAWTP